MNAKKTWRGVVLVMVGGLGATAFAHALPRQSRIPIARVPQAAPTAHSHGAGVICAGGTERLADIELIPDAIVTEGGRERVEYHAEITPKRGKGRLGIAWDADVITDRGQVVVAKLDSGAASKLINEAALTKPLIARLQDGFYALRVRAALASANEPSDVIDAVQYVEVRAGRWAELSDTEWFTRSRARETFTEADVKAMGGVVP